MKTIRLHQLVALLLVSCVSLAGSPPATSQTRPPTGQLNIVGGKSTAEWPGIGALAQSFPDGVYAAYCSGTLIGRDLVLTAAHCVGTMMSGYFTTGPTPQNPASIYAINEAFIHPNYVQGKMEFDLAMLRLEGPTEEQPLAISPIPPVVGLKVIVAGYGNTQPGGGYGTVEKHYGTTTISIVVPMFSLFTGMPQACFGDSGGPMFVESASRPVVIGVSVFVTQPACEWEAYSGYHRLDLPEVLDWLATFPGICYEGIPCDHLFVSSFDQ